ncbi:TonB-dependent receptor domain-containing protein [Catenovulum sediminis]|uniref:TonB-dependent receptor domain-containing protein n=1 Tax=Catenovulum sediminis TaxID=1740262 RepID=UPI0011806A03|nr:TonB-dependent receptor [Catenovulum sediminis]
MPTTQERFKLSALSFAILTSVSMQAYAAEDDSTEKEQKEEVEVIEVQGFRGSLAKSINDKRFAKNIADTINAEDIGKNTDQNIADALGRVTGVSIVSRDGEGSQITIRGATSQQNNISINGQQLTTTDFSQAVDLSTFSADILSRLEVIKTASADHDEGSLGGSVNLVTVKPLNVTDDIRSATIQGRYNDYADDTNYKLQLSLSEKFLDDTFGVALTAYNETNTTRRDQYKVEDFIASRTFHTASDLDGNIVTNDRAITHQNTGYELHLSETERSGLTLGLQWLPTDTSELTFDLTYTQQTKNTSFDGIKTRDTGGTSSNFIFGQKPLTNYPEYVAEFSDPHADWYVIDAQTKTMLKKVDRFGAGDISRSEGGSEEDNLSATLKYEIDITDDLRASAALGYSSSESKSLPNGWTNMQNWTQVTSPKLFEAGADVTPVGYDCTSGLCEMVTGDTLIGLGENILSYTDEDGAVQPGWTDNTNVLTGFNPRDLETFHMGFISVTDRTVEDDLANAQLDFDYFVDLGPVTSFEFGVKASKREKYVDDQVYTFTSSTQTSVIEDELGNKLVDIGGPLTDLRAPLIARESGLEYDDFMASLGYGRGPATSNWTPIDVIEARNLILDDSRTVPNIDNTKTRKTDIDTQSIYFKANFEGFDGRLTGDIGVRYVKTDVDASIGYGGANFWTHDATNLEREFDLVKLRELRDKSLPECRPLSRTDAGYTSKYERVDGLGWDTSSGPDPSNWTRIEDQGACHDPVYAEYYELATDGIDNDTQEFPVVSWASMWRYADVSTTHVWGWDSNITWDGETVNEFDTVGFTPGNQTNKKTQSVPSTGSHSYTNVLPSLNLNYAFSDEFVGRFAISKTMTRPEIDLLRSGFEVKEGGYWGGGNAFYNNSVFRYNTELDPLESKNLDLSLEWYFNPTSMLSVAYFRKDMSNFTDVTSSLAYLQDLRNLGDLDSVDPSQITMQPDETKEDFGLQGCMPIRSTADFPFNKDDQLAMSNDLRDLCAIYQINTVNNGKGAEINGLEFGYSQTYDFLPGVLGGLGVSANYTYQDSSYDANIDPVTGNSLPELPVADTPEHTYNFTTFWEQDGHQVRLSYRGTSDTLVGIDWNTMQRGRTWNQGSIWNEGRDSLDLSLSYKLNDQVQFTLQATNLTDAAYRTYFTSRTLDVQKVYADNDDGYTFVGYNEGNPLEGEAPKSRTYTNYKVGKTFRFGVRVNF